MTPSPRSRAVTLYRDGPTSCEPERWRSYKVDEYQEVYVALPQADDARREAALERAIAEISQLACWCHKKGDVKDEGCERRLDRTGSYYLDAEPRTYWPDDVTCHKCAALAALKEIA